MKRLKHSSLPIILLIPILLALTSCNKLGFSPPQRGYAQTSLVFDGLQRDEVKVSENRDGRSLVINFDFSPALNANGETSYEIYEGKNRENFLVRTKNTFWEYVIPNPEQSKALVFSVRAFDKDGGELNQEFVLIDLENPNDVTPPEFAGVKWAWPAAHNKVLLKWDASPSSDVSKYNIYLVNIGLDVPDSKSLYKLQNPIGSTFQNYFMVKRIHGEPLQGATYYQFVVRAVDASGNEEKNSVIAKTNNGEIPKTLTEEVPDFEGTLLVNSIPGIPGLNKLEVIWLPTVKWVFENDTLNWPKVKRGYRIYQAEAESNELLFETSFRPVETVWGEETTSVEIGGLGSEKQYFFVVHAIQERLDGKKLIEDQNRVVKMGATNSESEPPVFAGLDKLRPGENDGGFEKIIPSWFLPTGRGVYDGYWIRYENIATSGGCDQPFSATAESKKYKVADPSATSFELNNVGHGIEPNTTYKVRVNTVYSPNGVEDPNSRCMTVTTVPREPDFNGIQVARVASKQNGFHTLNLEWIPAEGSFTHYIIEAARDNNFTQIVRRINAFESFWYSNRNETGIPSTTECANVGTGLWSCLDAGYNQLLSKLSTTNWPLDNLPPKESLWVRVRAEYIYHRGSVDESRLESQVALKKKLSGRTEPVAPSDEGIVEVAVTSPTSLRVDWTEPTDTEALFNKYRIWKACGQGAYSKVSLMPDCSNPGAGVSCLTLDRSAPLTSHPIQDLLSDVECCFQVRAHFNDGMYELLSKSAAYPKCATPALVEPTFAGITKAFNLNDSNGFTQIKVEWNGRARDDRTNFSAYELSWVTCPISENCAHSQTWADPFYRRIEDETRTSDMISGLLSNRRYFFKVRAVHDGGGISKYAGKNIFKDATTTPARPVLMDINMQSLGASSIKITFTAPPAPSADSGLWDSIILQLVAPSRDALNTYYAANTTANNKEGPPPALVPNVVDITTSADAQTKKATVNLNGGLNAGKTVRIIGVTPGVEHTVILENLEQSGVFHHARMVAAYWGADQQIVNRNHYVESLPLYGEAKPSAQPPTFFGIQGFVKYDDQNDFERLKVVFNEAAGDCTKIEVSVVEASDTPSADPFKSNSDNVFKTADPDLTKGCVGIIEAVVQEDYNGVRLVPHKQYLVRVQAVFEPTLGGTRYTAGYAAERSVFLKPDLTITDQVTGITKLSVLNASDEMTASWANPGVQEEPWNKILLFRASNSNEASARAAVLSASRTVNDANGYHPANESASVAILKAIAQSSASHVFSDIQVNSYYCFLAMAVYDLRITDNRYYVASENSSIQCNRILFNKPSFAGVTAASRTGTCPDGTALITITISESLEADDSLDQYWVYYTKETSLSAIGDFGQWPTVKPEPWQKVDFGDSFYDANKIDSEILVGCKGNTISGGGRFHVRYYFDGDPDPANNADFNTSLIALSSDIAPQESNYVHVSKTISGFAYDYLMMAYEASLVSGTAFNPNDRVTDDYNNLSSCNASFHSGSSVFAGSCKQSHLSNAKVQSLANKSPANNISWHNAWYACRNSSTSLIRMRLPTEEEWRRASRWQKNDYSGMQSALSASCNHGGSVRNTGVSSCMSHVSAFDMAGNVSEWVDARMKEYNIVDNLEQRFSFGPSIGLLFKNGIDDVTRRYHRIVPTADHLALLLGSNYISDPGVLDYTQQKDPEAERWVDSIEPGSERGFRCAAFLKNQTLTQDDLRLPREPVYVENDRPERLGGDPAQDTLPEHLFVGDTKPESVAISASSTPNGKVTLTWHPWTKEGCDDGSCMKYYIYRFDEPAKMDISFSLPWAKLMNNNFTTDTLLDPLTQGALGSPIYTATTCNEAQQGNCVFEDTEASAAAGSRLLSRRRLYNYVLIAEDDKGNRMVGKVQHFRSPHFVGEFSTNSQNHFRTEIRIRRAGIFLVDESYQASQSPSQVMAFVPMDKSGLDHDYFIQKYEASNSGLGGTGSGQAGLPAVTTDGSDWLPQAATCYQKSLLNNSKGGTIAECGNTTSVSLASKANTSPVNSMVWGDMWTSCMNTNIVADGSIKYYLRLPTSVEWAKAADWGDVDHNNAIDQHINYASLTSYAVETNELNDGSTTCVSSPPVVASGTRVNCQSRYGVFDMVGNWEETVADKHYSGMGLDNGIDGLWRGRSLEQSTALSNYRIDLLLGIVLSLSSTNGWMVNGHGDFFWEVGTGESMINKGAYGHGYWGQGAGRWAIWMGLPVNSALYRVGFRCIK